MKKILIITPHFPPSNLAAVHRSRLFAQHLPAFGWEPTILMVDEKYYEEKLDYDLSRLVSEHIVIEKVKAFPVTKPRLIGDIGLRAFFQLYKKAKRIIVDKKIDFLYIPIPSFYTALLGRWLHKSTGIQYGIDYIDPWVHHFPKGDQLFSRHWFSEKIAKLLEPIAVKEASVITGVAEGYYDGVRKRNPHLKGKAVFGAMPYGAEESDHEAVKEMQAKPYLFQQNKEKLQLVYGGAMLPKAYKVLEAILKNISTHPEVFKSLEIHFIGTGYGTNDPHSYNIKPIAEKYGVWQTNIFEYPARIPYLDVLIHLNGAKGIFILGSTEKHYTPSKVFQAVLSEKPILAVLHEESSALKVVNSTGAGVCFPINENNLEQLASNFHEVYKKYTQFVQDFDLKNVNRSAFESYSAKYVTKSLVDLLNQVK